MEQTVVDSNEVLLEEHNESIVGETDQFSRTLANTRVVSQDIEYTVEATSLTEVQKINSFYYVSPDGNVQRLNHTPETNNLFERLNSDTEFDISALTIGELSPEHIARYPTSEVNKNITPIEPVKYKSERSGPKELYFADVESWYVAKIQLRTEQGDRQTVYKVFSFYDNAKQFVDSVGATVSLILEDGDTRLKSISNLEHNTDSVDTQSSQDDISLLNKLISVIPSFEDSVFTQLGYTSMMFAALFSIFSLLFGTYVFTKSAIGLWCLSGSTVLIGWLHRMYHDRNSKDTETTDASVSDDQDEDIETHRILLEPPEGLETERQTEEPVTSVTVDMSFSGDELQLTVDDMEQSPCWKYETTSSGVFENPKLVDFYTELGFDQSESKQFTAFVSTREYDGIPELETQVGDNSLYLHPVDPSN